MIQPSVSSNLTGVQAQNFTIEANESMFALLTSRVYSDTISAPIREWSTNAVDACIAANVTPRFDVHLPTFEEPTFSVRDYGDGLPHEDILGLFCTFGASTKRDSNSFNGTFGIGRMSGLAYASSFTVESYHNGHYYSYLITIKDGLPAAVELANSSTTKPSGLRLSLAVEPSQISTFQHRAQSIYKYFDTKPSLNIDLDITLPDPLISGDNWQIIPDNGPNVIRMANVVYRIPSDSQLNTQGLSHLLIDVPIGTIAINPGRESLSMDKHTLAYLNTMFSSIMDEYLTIVQSAIDGHSSPRDRCFAYYDAYKTSPYAVRKQLKAPALTTKYQLYYNGWGDIRVNQVHNSNINVRYFYRYNSTPTTIASRGLDLKIFLGAHIAVVDVKTNFSHILKHLNNSYNDLVVLSAVDSFDTFVSDANEFLQYYEFSDERIHYVSDHITPTEKATGSRTHRPSSIIHALQFDCLQGTFSNSFIPSDSDTHLYVPLKGHDSTLPSDHTHAIGLALTHFQKPLLGIQKKYLKTAEESDNYILADDFLKEHLPSKHFHVYDDYRQFDTILSLYAHTKFPKPFQHLLDEYSEHRYRKSDSNIIPQAHVDAISQFYDIDYTVHTPPMTRDELLQKMPLLHILRPADTENQQHYLDLEGLRHDSTCKDE